MLQSLSVNFNRRNEFTRLFELSKVYHPQKEGLPKELIFLTIGTLSRGQNMDFFDLKGDIEELFAALGINKPVFASYAELPFHPGRGAEIEGIGHMGEVHPGIAAEYDIGTRAYIAALALAPMIERINISATYVPLPKHPSISRDIALQVRQEFTAASIEKAIREKAGPLLADLSLFDIYQGKQLEEGYKSMAYKLAFRAADRTLTDEEVAVHMEHILKHLQDSLDIQLRDK